MSRAEWSADGIDLPTVDPHTKAKHRILEEYIKNLIVTLYGKGRYGVTTFTFVDAFCGGGMYRDPEAQEEWEGSPLKIIMSPASSSSARLRDGLSSPRSLGRIFCLIWRSSARSGGSTSRASSR